MMQENEKGIKSYRRFQMRTDILIIGNINVLLKSCCVAISDTISALILQKSPSSARSAHLLPFPSSCPWVGKAATVRWNSGLATLISH